MVYLMLYDFGTKTVQVPCEFLSGERIGGHSHLGGSYDRYKDIRETETALAIFCLAITIGDYRIYEY